jgi:hypothetical protein
VSDLRERLEAYFPAPVILEQGQSFVGVYERLERGWAEHRGPTWVLILRGNNGELHSLWLLHAALLNGLKRLRPKPGEQVGVRNLGKRKSATGSDYVDWRVAVDRPPPGWDAIDPADGEP